MHAWLPSAAAHTMTSLYGVTEQTGNVRITSESITSSFLKQILDADRGANLSVIKTLTLPWRLNWTWLGIITVSHGSSCPYIATKSCEQCVADSSRCWAYRRSLSPN